MINEPVILIIIPLFLAFLIPLLNLISKKIVKYIPFIASFLNLVYLSKLIPLSYNSMKYYSIGGYKIPFGINLIFNKQIGFLLIAINIVSFLALVYFSKKEYKLGNPLAYAISYTLAITSVHGMILTGDLFNLFVFMELAAIAGYIIATHKKGFYSSFVYVIISTVGSLFFLIATISVYNVSGNLNINTISQGLMNSSPQFLLIIGVLFIVALSSEAELLPLNAWVPKVYKKSSVTGSIFFATIFSTAALFAVIKLLILLFQGNYNYIYETLTVIGLLTLIVGEAVAFKQKNMKKMIAYSSIAQAGLIISAISVSFTSGKINKEIFNASMFQLYNNIFAKSLILFGLGFLGYFSINKLKGIAQNKKIVTGLMSIGVLSIAGMPPFAGFWSKFYLIKSLILDNHNIFVLIFLATAVFEVYYFFRFIQNLYFSQPTHEFKNDDIGLIPYLILGTLSFIIIFIGINPDVIYNALSDILLGGIV